MLSKIGIREKDVNVGLAPLCDKIYIVSAYHNPISFLQKGSIIWVDRDECYEVFELTESWIKEQETEASFVSRIKKAVG